MKYKIQYLSDVNGNTYVGIQVPEKDIQVYLDYCFSNIDNFESFNKNLLNRNHDTYHITLFNVGDYYKNQKYIDNIIGDEIDLKFVGVGSLSDQTTDNITYYVVVNSYIINAIRNQFGLDDITPHVTIGFKYKDIIKSVKNIANVFSY